MGQRVAVYNGSDGEFGIATGSNVDAGSQTSQFDGSPADTTNLVISSSPGDTQPGYFELGEFYDVSYTGPDGAVFLDDAVVLRSDNVGAGGIVVFEGTDQNGNEIHVAWTPDFDLQSWWDSSSRGGTRAASFWRFDQNAAYSHGYVCFTDDVPIRTPLGYRPAGQIAAGDWVTTLDGGIKQVRWVGQKTTQGQDDATAPVLFEPGAIGNDVAIRLSPQHRVVVRGPACELLFGHAEVFVPAKSLITGYDVRSAPTAQVTYVHILLDDHHVLDAAGSPCESLYTGPASQAILDNEAALGADVLTGPSWQDVGVVHTETALPVLTYNEARLLIASQLSPTASQIPLHA